METVTPLLNRLSSTTTCGQLAMCAGVLEWGIWRLEGHVLTESARCLHDAAFVFQVDRRYADPKRGEVGKAPEQPAALSALMQLKRFLRQAMSAEPSYYQPIRETFHSAHIVQHILPRAYTKAFGEWLDALAGRVRNLAPKPDEPFRKKKEFDAPEEYQEFLARHWGAPLPPQVLDPEGFDPDQRAQLVAEFVADLDWQANPYLRSPGEMKEMGFPGEPYRV
jgi:hypothetical protein